MRNRSWRLRSLGVTMMAVALVVGSSPPVWAVMQGMSTDELIDQAEAIVIGEVEEIQSRWDSRGRIVTDVRVQVHAALKGAVGQFVVVTQDGGVIGDLGMKVSDTPTFRQGESVICFLRSPDPSGGRWLLGKAQGKYRIDADGWVRKGEFTVGPGADQVEWAAPFSSFYEKIRRRVQSLSGGAP